MWEINQISVIIIPSIPSIPSYQKKNIYLIKKIPSIPWKKVVAITVKQTYFFVLIKWMYFSYQMGVASWLRFTSYFWIWFFELFLDLEQSSWV